MGHKRPTQIQAENARLIEETHNWRKAYNDLKEQCERQERTISELKKVNGAQLQRLVHALLLVEHHGLSKQKASEYVHESVIDWSDMRRTYDKADPLRQGYMAARFSGIDGSTIPEDSPYELGSRNYREWLLGKNAARLDEADGTAI